MRFIQEDTLLSTIAPNEKITIFPLLWEQVLTAYGELTVKKPFQEFLAILNTYENA